ncbi:MAG: hypothetical protein EBR82_47510 [Caulobacteraceae bacterium]|nr:hypothetical protein [Caulobacteraceae bacterium]
MRWQQAATRFEFTGITSASNGSPGHIFQANQNFEPLSPTYANQNWCDSDATVPQFGIYLGEFASLPVIERRSDGKFYYRGTNTQVISSNSGILGHTCKVGLGLYTVDTFIPFTDQWYRWNVRGAAADRSCERQTKQLRNSLVTAYQEATPPSAALLALNSAQTQLSSTGAIVAFLGDAPTYTITAMVSVGSVVPWRTQYPGTNCGVGVSVQVSAKFRSGASTVPALPTLTVSPSYTERQSRGLLPWSNVPGCKAWIVAPYYTSVSPFVNAPETDISQFANLRPWWDYDLLAQQGISVAYNNGVPDTAAVYTSDASAVSASFSSGIQFRVLSFSGAGSTMRWIDYGGGGVPLWRTGWTFSENMVNPNASNPCSWTFSGTSQPANRQYARTTDVGSISSATVVLG